jgi:CO/xanthine dehydrogenase FAD-binding subunit
VRDFFVADGIANTRRLPGEILVEVRIPLVSASRRQAYAKLRQRKSIDFPLLTVAVAADIEPDGVVRALAGVVTGLGARPKELTGWSELSVGHRMDDALVDALAERARAQCRPLENMTVDPEWRRAMVGVYVRRALGRLRG